MPRSARKPLGRSKALDTGLLALAICLALTAHAYAQADHGGNTPTAQPTTNARSTSPAVQAPRITTPYASPELTRNPVAITFDNQGNVYVAEAWRQGNGVIAIVNIPGFQNGDLQADLTRTTIQEREENIDALIARGAYPPGYFTDTSDQVRLLRDTDNDGVADQSTVFADGFNAKADGNAAGVLWLDGRVYLTNIPNLWLLEDRDGDGDADAETEGERISLSYGYGLRWSYSGHDLHGLIKGHDGRIYFSLGDRGYNVTTQEGEQLVGLNHGAVFRMWPDGSGLEVFYTGLRNPQELAFDNYGNLFTGDNNSDAGDLARFCYLPEGGDSGWRQDVQTIDSRGPWNRERMWEPRLGADEVIQPAWIIPPLANVGRGPSGLTHYPGTGDVFPDNGSFLMCDYPTGVRHVVVEPSGAGFRVVEDSSFVEGQTITDAAWGYDGRLYLSDWGGGYQTNPRGHIKVMVNAAAHEEQAEAIAEVQQLFAEGFDGLSLVQLADLFSHPDQRVRLAAQWEFASRRDAASFQGLALLQALILESNANEIASMHAIWTSAMMCRAWGLGSSELAEHCLKLGLQSGHPRVHALTIATIGDLAITYPEYNIYLTIENIQAFIQEGTPAVQYHAAIALGKSGNPDATPVLMDLLESNDNRDVYIRHAASYGLYLIGDAEAIDSEAKRRGSAARLGAVLALRRLKSPLLAEYLEDADPLVAAEAVRAIYDMRIADALPALAALADTLPPERMTEPVMRRVIEVNVRQADAQGAQRIAQIAANPDAPDAWRALALEELTHWSAPRNRDGVWGWWWPRPEQGMQHASDAMAAHLPAIKATATGDTLTQARVFELTHILHAGRDELAALARNSAEPDEVRLAGVQMLAGQDRGATVTLAEEMLAMPDTSASLRSALRAIILPLNRDAGVRVYLQALETGTVPEQQEAIRALALIRTGEAINTMSALSEQLLDGTLAPELRLDVYQMLMKYRNLPIAARNNAMQYREQNTLEGESPMIRDTLLAGGSAEAGRRVFENHPAAQCTRCHRLDNRPAAGPNLSGIGSVKDMGYLYNAVIHPSRDIARGFASTTVTLTNGSLVTGRLDEAATNDDRLVLIKQDGGSVSIPRNEIDGEPVTDQLSMMPPMAAILSPAELRDVLAYLASLEADPTDPGSAYGASARHSGSRVADPMANVPIGMGLGAMLLTTGGGLFLLLMGTVLLNRKASAAS